MNWMLLVKNLAGEVMIGPETYLAGSLAYRRSHEIAAGKIDLTRFISPDSTSGDLCLGLQIHLSNGTEQVLFMEKRGYLERSEQGICIRWADRPSDEKPFRVTIRADYCSYAWDEYGMPWFVDESFPEHSAAIELDKDFSAWLRVFENTDIDHNGRAIINFEWREFHAVGQALARRLKALGGDDMNVFYQKPYEDTFIVEDIQIVKSE